MTGVDIVTVIRARRNRCLAKIVRPSGVTDYDAPFRFDFFPRPVTDLKALHALLSILLQRTDCAVVRGVPLDPERIINVRRLLYADKETGDAPTLADAAHHWVALDIDGVARPDDTPAADLEACARLAIGRLPPAFQAARCLIQATASHGLKPGVRVRLWFWLDRPTAGGELTRWLRATPADPSVFRGAQLVYTAAPRFLDGATDHLPARLIAREGNRPTVAVPPPAALAPLPRPAPTPLPAPNARGAGAYAFAALRGATARIAQAREGARHHTLVGEARALARFVSAGLLSAADVRTALGGAITLAGKDLEEAEAVWRWAVDHPSAAPLPAGVAP